MNKAPGDLRYTKTHEWVRKDGAKFVVGITDYAQEAMGDIVFVELPAPGRAAKAGDNVVVVESVKAVSDVYMPLGGKVAEANSDLEASPEKINESPYESWLFSVDAADAGEFDRLMTSEQYLAFLLEEGKE